VQGVSSDLREQVAQLTSELEGPGVEYALCGLTSLPPEAIPLVAEAYHRETKPRRRRWLIHALWQFRDSAALSTLAVALGDGDDQVWKEALDGVVTLGGADALRVLEEARDGLPSEGDSSVRRAWIDEAIQQVQEARDPG
jgi:hypothetical protein